MNNLLDFAVKNARTEFTPNVELRKNALAAEVAQLLHPIIGSFHGYKPTTWFGTTTAERHALVQCVHEFLQDMAPPKCVACGDFLPDLHGEPFCGKPGCEGQAV